MCAFTANYKKPTLKIQVGDNDDGNDDDNDHNPADPIEENNYNDFGKQKLRHRTIEYILSFHNESIS